MEVQVALEHAHDTPAEYWANHPELRQQVHNAQHGADEDANADADEMEENTSDGTCMLQNPPAMATTAPESAGHPPADTHRDQSKRQGDRYNVGESPGDSRMADIIPTMAEANPKRAGQSPEDQSRQHIRSADEKTRWAGYQLADQQGMLEGAVGSQADVSPTMAEAIPLGAGQSLKKDRRG